MMVRERKLRRRRTKRIRTWMRWTC